MGVSKLRCLDICADGSPKPNFSSYYICTIFYQWCNISATHRVYSKKESLSWFWVISALHQLVCSIYHGYYALTITQKPHIKKYIIVELITRWLKLIFPPQPLVHVWLNHIGCVSLIWNRKRTWNSHPFPHLLYALFGKSTHGNGRKCSRVY